MSRFPWPTAPPAGRGGEHNPSLLFFLDPKSGAFLAGLEEFPVGSSVQDRRPVQGSRFLYLLCLGVKRLGRARLWQTSPQRPP